MLIFKGVQEKRKIKIFVVQQITRLDTLTQIS